MIIALTGSMGSGKDTVAHMLCEHHGFRAMSFAGTLKQCVAAVFHWSEHLLAGRDEVSRQWREQVDPWWSQRLGIENLTPRWVLQHIGTDVMRNHFHPDIWVASVQRQLVDSAAHTVLTDARFPNEIHMVQQLGGELWRVQRGALPPWWQLAESACDPNCAQWAQCRHMLQTLGIHDSEWSWAGCEPDVVIHNSGTLAQLQQQVSDLVSDK